MLLSSIGQNLSANQISSAYLNPWLRYNYFQKKTRPPYWNSTPCFDIDCTSACHCALGCVISSKSIHPQRRDDVISIFKMAAAAAQFYFRFQIGCRLSFFGYQFVSANQIRSWDITRYISGLGKQTYVILEFYFRLNFDHITPVG